MNATTFAARLRAARKRAALTQAAVGARVGYAPNTVARWERGDFTPRAAVQQAVLALLHGAVDRAR